MATPRIVHIFANRRMAVLFALGFSSGLPFMLTFGTLQAWLGDAKVSLRGIGIFALVWYPYAFKFLWSPLMDRYVPPLLGRRRGWLVLTQLALICSICAMALIGPGRSLYLFGFAALLVAFFSASQDIVADAYRTDVLPDEERGAGAAIFVTGYRVGLILSSAAALVASGRFGLSWPAIYFALAGFMVFGLAATLLAEEPATPASAPKTLTDAVVHPLLEFWRRSDGLLVILFILLFKLPEVAADGMKIPFLMSLGASKEEIGVIGQGVGLTMTILGALIGGGIVAKLGLWRSLWLFGILGAVSNLAFYALAISPLTHWKLAGAICTENFCAGLVTAGFAAFLMSQCDRRFSATQYALLSSLMALTKVCLLYTSDAADE